MPDDNLQYTIRRSTRARRIRIRVDAHEGVEVVIPQRATTREAQEAVEELRPWIERRLHEVTRARQRLESPPGTVPFLGAHLSLRRDPRRTRAARRGDELWVPDAAPHEALERWYRIEARK